MCESPVVRYLLFTPCNKCVENQQAVLEPVILNLILRNAYSENFFVGCGYWYGIGDIGLFTWIDRNILDMACVWL